MVACQQFLGARNPLKAVMNGVVLCIAVLAIVLHKNFRTHGIESHVVFCSQEQKLSFVGSFPHEEVFPKLMLPKKAEISLYQNT